MQLFLGLILIAIPLTIAVLPLDTAQPQFSIEPINESAFQIEKPLPSSFWKMDGGGVAMRCGVPFSFSAFYA